jgi:hypothetical protein
MSSELSWVSVGESGGTAENRENFSSFGGGEGGFDESKECLFASASLSISKGTSALEDLLELDLCTPLMCCFCRDERREPEPDGVA